MCLTSCRPDPLARSGQIATALSRLLALTVMCVFLSGCTGEQSADVGGEIQGSGTDSGVQAEEQEPASPNTDAGFQSQGEMSNAADDDPEMDGEEAAGNTSPLDEAIARQAEKPERVEEGVDEPEAEPAEPVAPHEELLPLIDKSWVRLHPLYEVWLDPKGKQVIVGGRICFRKGPLEMFACPQRTKEHESIVSTISNGEIVHTGLLAAGAVPGSPVKWDPEYVPPSGPVIDILVKWAEEEGVKEAGAKEWVLDATTNEAMTHDWVYAGSGEWTDSNNPSHREFFADAGDLICVTNFSTALLDVRVESTPNNAGLMFYAYTDRIPPLGKPVLLFLKPQLEKDAAETGAAADANDREGDQANPDEEAAMADGEQPAEETALPEDTAEGDDG